MIWKLHIIKSAILLHLFVLVTYSYSGWERTFGNAYRDAAFAVDITSEKDYILCGRSRDGPYPRYFIYLIKISEEGDSIWARRYIIGDGHDVKTTNDGGYILSGYNDAEEKYYLLKTNADGDTIWSNSTIDCSWYSRYSSVVQLDDGSFAALWSFSPDFIDLFVVKTDEYGDTLWSKIIGRPLNDFGTCIVSASDGSFIIVGSTCVGSSSEVDAYIVKIDSLGEVIWDVNYGGIGRNDAYYISPTNDGNYIITGETSLYYSSFFDVYLLKINEDGDTLWTRQYGGVDQSDVGRCVKQTTDNGFIIAGYTYSYGIGTPEYSNVYLIKTDSLGNLEWQRTFGGMMEDKGYSVSQTDDGGYIVAGEYDHGPHTDVYIIKTDSLGYSVWIREIPIKPEEISLNVYPNPFNTSCKIEAPANVTIQIFDLTGREIAALPPELQSWRPDNNITSGVYLVKAAVGEKIITKKVVYLK